MTNEEAKHLPLGSLVAHVHSKVTTHVVAKTINGDCVQITLSHPTWTTMTKIQDWQRVCQCKEVPASS